MKHQGLFRKSMSRWLLLLALMLFCYPSALAFYFSAPNEQGKTIYYNVVNSDSAWVEVTYRYNISYGHCYDGYGDLIIPSTVFNGSKTYTVTGIGSRALMGASITSLTLPNTLRTISSESLCGIPVSTLTIPESVTSIGYCAISSNGYGTGPSTSIKKLYYNAKNATSSHDSHTNNSGTVFYYGPFMLDADCEVIIGNNVEKIPSYLFCNSLFSSIDIPSGVTNIGQYAFYNCNNLSTVTLGQNITSIGYYAFDECPSLATVIALMPTPPTIFDLTFSNSSNATLFVPAGCGPYYSSANYWKNFKEIIETSKIYFVDPNVESICVANWDTNHDGYLSVLEAFLVDDLGTVFQGKTQITHFNELRYFINLNRIADNAFDGCSNLSSVTLPDCVTEIGNYAFRGCANFSALPDISHVTAIGEGAFANCTGLTTIDLNIRIITNNAFQGCTGLTSVTFGSAVVDIQNGAFKNCTSLAAINIPGSVQTIRGAFEGCTSLSSVSLNTGILNIINGTFKDCTRLTEITLPSGLLQIGQNAFEGTGLSEIDIPSSVTSVMENAFANCSNLSRVIANWTIPIGIPAEAFPNRANQLLIVPEGLVTTYQTTNMWKDFRLVISPDDIGKPYVIYSDNVLSFYNDNQLLTRSGTLYLLNDTNHNPGWFDDGNCEMVTAVRFAPAFAAVRPVTTASWFAEMYNLTSIEDIGYLNTEDVTDMHNMFGECSALQELDVTHFNTSKVTDMSYMFSECSSLESLDVSGFDTHAVMSMNNMFAACSMLTALDVTHFNTSKVTDMSYMFGGCSSLESLDVSGFDTHAVMSMYNMFTACSMLTTLDVSGFNTSNVNDMSGLFRNCTSLLNIDVSHFDTRNVTDMGQMFKNCSNLTTIYVSERWSTVNLTASLSSHEMFAGCTNLKGDLGTIYDPNHVDKAYARIDGGSNAPGYLSTMDYAVYNNGTLTFYHDTQRGSRPYTMYSLNRGYNKPDWNTDNCCNSVSTVVFDPSFAAARPTSTSWWFGWMGNLTSIEGIEHLNTSEVTNMSNMFSTCWSMEEFDLSHFDTRNVADMSYMFNYCEGLTSLDLSSFNTSNVNTMEGMFYECSGLSSLDLSSFDTEHVNHFKEMFIDCARLTSLDLRSFDTQGAQTMEGMFMDCSGLNSIDLSSFNTVLVDNMSSMFSGCTNLTTLDLTSFNTSYLLTTDWMFYYCRNLRTIYVGDDWGIGSLDSSEGMFKDCVSLVGGQGTTYDANHVDDEYAHIDGGPDNPGYFSEKPQFVRGDVNGDGQVRINDVTALIDYLLSGDDSNIIVGAADCNEDNQVRINDVTALIDFLLSGTW